MPIKFVNDMTRDIDAILYEPYHGWCTSFITPADADKLDAFFKKHKLPLSTDRDLLGRSKEAWVHVKINCDAKQDVMGFWDRIEWEKFAGMKAVFCYGNSD